MINRRLYPTTGADNSTSAALLLMASFLTVSLTFGGAGSHYPLLELFVELTSLAVLFSFSVGIISAPGTYWSRLVVFSSALVVLPALMQLVPLPSSIERELPGRETYRELLGMIGANVGPRPLSLDPEETWRSLLELVTGLAAFVGVSSLTTIYRARLIVIILCVAVASVVIGGLQAADTRPFIFLDSTQNGLPLGLFSNRNHQAIFLNIAIVLCGTQFNREYPLKRHWSLCISLIGLLVAGVIGTQSRTGIALLLISVPAALALHSGDKINSRSAVYVLVGVLLTGALVWCTSVGQSALDRFKSTDQSRLSYWADTKAAIAQYWPAGSGFGTFRDIFQSVESLSSVGPNFVNHAHNDYLELALEGGLVATLAAAAAAAFLVKEGVLRIGRSKPGLERSLGQAGLVGIALILLHSVVDYPLRMLSLMALFGTLAGLLMRPPMMEDRSSAAFNTRRLSVQLPVRAAATAAIFFLAYEARFVQFANFAVQSGNVALAQSLAPRSAAASNWLATRYLAEARLKTASTYASNALRLSPDHFSAVAVLAVAESEAGHAFRAAELMDIAAGGGWRDPLTQVWLLDTALKAGETDVAAQRADALLRQQLLKQDASNAARRLLTSESGRRALTIRMVDKPAWRTPFLRGVSGLTDSQLADQSQLMSQMQEAAVTLSEKEWVPTVRELIRRNHFTEARRLWRQMRGLQSTDSQLFDGSFEEAAKRWPAADVPFEWAVSPLSQALVSIGHPTSARPALRITAGASIAGPVVQQLLTLAPGAHSAFADVIAGDPATLRFDLRCGAGQHIDASPPMVGDRPGILAVRFVVPQNCEAQWLRVAVTPRGAPVDLWLGNIRVE
jgi:O-antigen ligase